MNSSQRQIRWYCLSGKLRRSFLFTYVAEINIFNSYLVFPCRVGAWLWLEVWYDIAQNGTLEVLLYMLQRLAEARRGGVFQGISSGVVDQ